MFKATYTKAGAVQRVVFLDVTSEEKAKMIGDMQKMKGERVTVEPATGSAE